MFAKCLLRDLDYAISLLGLAQAESKRIAGLPRDGVPAGRSYMQKTFVGKPEPRVQFARCREYPQAVRNGLSGLPQADEWLSPAHVLAFAQILLRNSNVVEQVSW